jgi:ribosome biogenesis GTPase
LGCAILAAMETGDLSPEEYENYQKLQREKEHYEASIVEKRKKDKSLGKMYKSVINMKKQQKF